MTKLNISLEWFINPDHLPFIAGVQSGAFRKAGLDVNIIEPKEHYDGFESLKNGEIDIHTNEPLHLFEHYFDGIKSLGCFFETRGGVMIRKSSIDKLKANQKIKITTPASNDVTNKIGSEILLRYAKREGFELSASNIEFIETDFYHLKNMQDDESFDGAWLCFYNFEGIEAEYICFENLFIDQFVSPYPNFSALEMMTTQTTLNEKGDAIKKFIEICENMVQELNENKEDAKSLYYKYTKEEKSELMDLIIEDTLPRLSSKIISDDKKWLELNSFFEDLGLVTLSKEQYDSIWIKQ